MPFEDSWADENARFRSYMREIEREKAIRASSSPDLARAIGDLHTVAPNVPPSVTYSVAQAQVAGAISPGQAFQTMMSAMKTGVNQALIRADGEAKRRQAEKEKGWGLNVFEGFKGVVRTGLGILQSPQQIVATRLSQAASLAKGAVSEAISGDVGASITKLGALYAFATPAGAFIDEEGSVSAQNPLKILGGTTLGQSASAAISGENPFTMQGAGYFPSGEIERRRQEDERQARGYYLETGPYRGSVGGEFAARQVDQSLNLGVVKPPMTNTLGRVVAGVVTEPGSDAFNWLSGATDFTAAVVADPSIALAKTAQTARLAGKMFKADSVISDADVLKMLGPEDIIAVRADDRIADSVRMVKGVERGQRVNIDSLLGQDEAFKRVKSSQNKYLQGVVNKKTGVWTPLDDWMANNKLTDLQLRPGSSIKTGTVRQVVSFEDVDSLKGQLYEQRVQAGIVHGRRGSFLPQQATAWLEGAKGTQFADLISKTKDPETIFRAFGKRIDPETLTRLVAADDTLTVKGILTESLGRSVRSLDDLGSKRLAVRNRATEAIQRWSDRSFANVPSPRVSLDPLASANEKVSSLANLLDYMTIARVPRNVRASVFGKYAKALGEGTGAARQQAKLAVMDALQTTLDTQIAIPDWLPAKMRPRFDEAKKKLIEDLLSWGKEDGFQITRYMTDGSGNPFDGDFLSSIPVSLSPEDAAKLTENIKLVSPSLMTEGLDGAFVLPDIRRVRALTSDVGWITRKTIFSGSEAGKMRFPAAAIQTLQENLFIPLNLLRPAFAVRVIGEELVRLAAQGEYSTALRSPLDYVMWAVGRRGKTDILGANFTDEAVAGVAHQEYSEFAKALNAISRNGPMRGAGVWGDSEEIERAAFRLGAKTLANYRDNPTEWVNGFANEARKLSGDWIARQVMLGEDNPTIIKQMMEGSSPEALTAYRELASRMNGGYTASVLDQTGTVIGRRKVYMDSKDPRILSEYIDRIIRTRVDMMHGSDATEDLRRLMVDGRVHLERSGIHRKSIDHLVDDPATGRQFAKYEGAMYEVTSVTEGGTYNLRSIDPVSAWKSDNPYELIPEARRVLEDRRSQIFMQEDKLEMVPYSVLESSGEALRTGPLVQFGEAKDKLFSFGMRWMYGKPTDYLNRSPMFRQAYWREVARLADDISPAEARKLRNDLKAQAYREGFKGDIARYLGGGDVGKGADLFASLDATLKKAARGDNPVGSTIEQVDQWAKAYALDETTELLFDAARKSNIADAAKGVFIFGEAWREVLTTWTKLMLDSYGRVPYRFAQTIESARTSDPDGDGRGFFYRDPRTGQEMFSYPFGREAIEWITGASTGVLGRVEGLNIGLSILPGGGVAANVALDKIIPDKPEWDRLAGLVFGDYGRPEGGLSEIAAIPSWAEKVVAGFSGDENNRLFSDTYMRVAQQLMAQGKYPRTAIGTAALMEEARGTAKYLLIIRGLAQSALPTSPSYDEDVATKIGEIPASVLITEWNRLSKEDYSTAVEEFIQMYGQDVAPYMVGRSRSKVPGLLVTAEYSDWQRSGGDSLIKRFPEIGGYFGPTGGQLDFQAMQRQLNNGQRERIDVAEMIRESNRLVARARYERLEAKFPLPSKRTEEQRLALMKFRESLAIEYPGYNPVADFNIGEFSAKIADLRNIVTEATVRETDTGRLLKSYLSLRDKAIAAAREDGLEGIGKAKRAQPLREWLADYGERMSAVDSGFARLYKEVLSRETEVEVAE